MSTGEISTSAIPVVHENLSMHDIDGVSFVLTLQFFKITTCLNNVCTEIGIPMDEVALHRICTNEGRIGMDGLLGPEFRRSRTRVRFDLLLHAHALTIH